MKRVRKTLVTVTVASRVTTPRHDAAMRPARAPDRASRASRASHASRASRAPRAPRPPRVLQERPYADVDAEYFDAVDHASPRARRFVDDVRLILLRHGKSDWSVEGTLDRLRPLKARGRARAARAGAALRMRGWIPDVIVTSDATRAVETVASACVGMGLERPRVMHVPELYESTHGEDVAGAASARAIGAAVLKSVQLTDETVMCVGHNYGFELAAREMAKCGELEADGLTLKTAHAALFTRRGRGSVGDRFYEVRAAPLRGGASAFKPLWFSTADYKAVIFCVSGVVVRAKVGEAPRSRETLAADPWVNGFEKQGGFTFEGVLDPDREFDDKIKVLENVVERKLRDLAHGAEDFGKPTLKSLVNAPSIRDMEKELMVFMDDDC